MPAHQKNLFGKIQDSYQFPERQVLMALRDYLGIAQDAPLVNYLCDQNIALQFENPVQAAFDQVIFTRRASDKKPLLQLLEITLNRGTRYKHNEEDLMERLERKSAHLRTLLPYFNFELGVDSDQLVYIHVMFCKLPNWTFNEFNKKTEQQVG